MATQYHVYSNGGSGGPINYGSPIATVTTPGYLTSALTAGDWSFAVRAFDTVSGLEEQNTEAVVDVAVDASLADLTNVPESPRALSVLVAGSGTLRVAWTHPSTNRARAPLGFHIYQGTGLTLSYVTPIATVGYVGLGYLHYHADITGLTGGQQYAFGVRAYNATGEEANLVVAVATALTTAPANVDSLTATSL